MSETGHAEIVRAGRRPVSRGAGLVSRHSFSFGVHYDPANVGFGLLVVNNDDLLDPGAGYDTHPHRDVEIVTWVLEGALVHRDSTGGGGVIEAGLVQRMSAGSGVLHSEFNDAPGRRGPLRFVQMWLPPDAPGGDPGYEQRELGTALDAGGLVTVASGRARDAGTAAIGLGSRTAAMHVARLSPGETVTLPGAPFVHVFVTGGPVEIERAGRLADGDALRLTDEGGRAVRAGGPSEIIVWEMHAGLHRPVS